MLNSKPKLRSSNTSIISLGEIGAGGPETPTMNSLSTNTKPSSLGYHNRKQILKLNSLPPSEHPS